MKIQATVGILTFNSEKTIKRALESVKDFDDVLICDGGSTDNTVNIAVEHGARVIEQNEIYKDERGRLADFSGVRNQCIDAAQYDWFFYIDSDEAASSGLVEEIREVINKEDDNLVYKIPMRILIKGREILYSSNYPGWQTRFFNRRSGARFIKKVHERIDFPVDVPVGQLKNPWFVFMTDDEVKHYYRENHKYALLQAKASEYSFGEYLQKGVWGLLLNIAKIKIKTTRNYLLHGSKDTMPLSVEWGRILYQLSLMWLLFKKQLSLK